MEELFEITSWVTFKKPGLKKEIIELSKTCADADEFKTKLQDCYQVSLSTAYILSKKFYKPQN